jgi:transcriptional regulator
VLVASIGAIRFAALVAIDNDGLQAAHLPMRARERSGSLVLEGHVARGNPMWSAVGAGATALAVFQGPQAYVHPGWLVTKRETGRVVPTWNYIAVHAHGRLSSIDDRAWLRGHVDELTSLTEADRPEPWATSDAPDDYIDGLLGGIVGLRLEVERLEGVWKLIQHHPQSNRLGVIAGLSASKSLEDQAMAVAMRDAESRRAAG